MYVHKRCVPEGAELDLDRVAHGYCGVCGRRGTIWLLVGTEDSYKTKRQGVTYTVTAVGALTDEEVAIAEAKTNTTYIAPIDTDPEVELPEGIEAVEDAVTEAVEAEIEAAVPEEREPEETFPEGETVTTITETPLDAESEASTTDDAKPLSETTDQSTSATETPVEAEPEYIEAVTAVGLEETIKADKARKAEIARLEAELEALRK